MEIQVKILCSKKIKYVMVRKKYPVVLYHIKKCASNIKKTVIKKKYNIPYAYNDSKKLKTMI